jgi:ADP-heptose:LPS heptosyltransferase
MTLFRKIFSFGFRVPLFWVVDLCYFTLSKLLKRDPRSALVIRLDAIGDFIVWQPYARRIYEHLRKNGKKVILAVDHNNYELAIASNIADQVIPINAGRFRKSLTYRLGIMRRISGLRVSIAIQPTFSRALLIGDSVVCASGAQKRIGCRGDYSNSPRALRWLWDTFYTDLVEIPTALNSEFHKNKAITEKITGEQLNLELAQFDLSGIINPLTRHKSSKMDSQKYVVLFPGAGWSGRRWPVERFAEITEELNHRGLLVVIAGGKSEKDLADKIRQISRVDLVDLTGSTSLLELMALVRDSNLVITNETSAVHIAACQQRPAICILGGGHFDRFAPYPKELEQNYPVLPTFIWHKMSCYQCNWQCIYPRTVNQAVKCIMEVSLDRVKSALDDQLAFR